MKVRIVHIIAAAEQVLNLPQGVIRSDRRFRKYSGPRQIVMYIANRRFGKSLGQIGRILKRHHTSALSGVRKISKRLETEPHLRPLVAKIGDAAERLAAGIPVPPCDDEEVRLVKKPKPYVLPKRLAPATADKQDMEEWFLVNDRRFREAMRALYPEREKIQQRGHQV